MISSESPFDDFFEQVLFNCFGKAHEVDEYHFVSGGAFNQTVEIHTSAGCFLLKWNEHLPEDMFEAETLGLNLLRSAHLIDIPEVFGFGKVAQKSFLLMEWIQAAMPEKNYWSNLGESIAELHRQTAHFYGLDFNNYIGTLFQNNEKTTNWLDFFVHRRLEAQVGLAYYNNLLNFEVLKKFEQLYARLSGWLPAHSASSLLHGDLWGGNVLVNSIGAPALIDPAVYYGNREMEIAFTKLFGGFEPKFYEAYHATFPLDPGFEERTSLYQLYPLLVHLNLFGKSYLNLILKILNKFLD
ncbi:MAG TPA: ketosamine-3-kinase [Microscillaceae bacterium]|nr:ketosamine-3-kinase [Microscillaceae bacterium]